MGEKVGYANYATGFGTVTWGTIIFIGYLNPEFGCPQWLAVMFLVFLTLLGGGYLLSHMHGVDQLWTIASLVLGCSATACVATLPTTDGLFTSGAWKLCTQEALTTSIYTLVPMLTILILLGCKKYNCTDPKAGPGSELFLGDFNAITGVTTLLATGIVGGASSWVIWNYNVVFALSAASLVSIMMFLSCVIKEVDRPKWNVQGFFTSNGTKIGVTTFFYSLHRHVSCFTVLRRSKLLRIRCSLCLA